MSHATSRTLRLHRPGHEDRKPTWLELFYDLIYVAAIIQLGNLLAADASLAGAAMFVFLFVAVWWSWTGMMFYFNRFVADDPLQRMLLFAQMFAIAAMAVTVSQAFGAGSAAFALSYFAVRAILVLLYLRAHRAVAGARPLIGRYVAGFGLAALVWLASAFVPPPYRFGCGPSASRSSSTSRCRQVRDASSTSCRRTATTSPSATACSRSSSWASRSSRSSAASPTSASRRRVGPERARLRGRGLRLVALLRQHPRGRASHHCGGPLRVDLRPPAADDRHHRHRRRPQEAHPAPPRRARRRCRPLGVRRRRRALPGRPSPRSTR
jgi:hypothetical protein